MKWIKRIGLILLSGLLVLFLPFFVEYDFGLKKSPGPECKISQGMKQVYVHWLKPLNHTVSVFCDGSLSPHYMPSKRNLPCDCKQEK